MCYLHNKMKEEITRKPKSKDRGDLNFFRWEHLDFSLQTKKYFSIVRHLHNKGLNMLIRHI
jgi:hypothetical protein